MRKNKEGIEPLNKKHNFYHTVIMTTVCFELCFSFKLCAMDVFIGISRLSLLTSLVEVICIFCK